jgi:hypothetical protein
MSEESLDQRLKSLLMQGRKIEAVKLCKDGLSIEFDEAKQYIEEMAQGIESELKNVPPHNTSTPIPAESPETNVPIQDLTDVSIEKNLSESSKISNTNQEPNASDMTKEEVNDDKISLKTKIITGIVFLLILKGCSYSSNGGAEYGIIANVLFKIADTVIPYPETQRNHSFIDVIAPENADQNVAEVDNAESDDTESNPNTNQNMAEENNSKNDEAESNENLTEEVANAESPNTQELNDDTDKDNIEIYNNEQKNKLAPTIIEVEERDPGKGEIKLSNGGYRSYGIINRSINW